MGSLRSKGGLWVWGVWVLLLASRANAAEVTQAEIDNRRCLNCHGQSRMAEMPLDERARAHALGAAFRGSAVARNRNMQMEDLGKAPFVTARAARRQFRHREIKSALTYQGSWK